MNSIERRLLLKLSAAELSRRSAQRDFRGSELFRLHMAVKEAHEIVSPTEGASLAEEPTKPTAVAFAPEQAEIARRHAIAIGELLEHKFGCKVRVTIEPA